MINLEGIKIVCHFTLQYFIFYEETCISNVFSIIHIFYVVKEVL